MTPFEQAARVAIEELIVVRGQSSKFGLFLSKEAVEKLTDDLYDLMLTSRSLKSSGDRLLAILGGAQKEDKGEKGEKAKTQKTTPRQRMHVK